MRARGEQQKGEHRHGLRTHCKRIAAASCVLHAPPFRTPDCSINSRLRAAPCHSASAGHMNLRLAMGPAHSKAAPIALLPSGACACASQGVRRTACNVGVAAWPAPQHAPGLRCTPCCGLNKCSLRESCNAGRANCIAFWGVVRFDARVLPCTRTGALSTHHQLMGLLRCGMMPPLPMCLCI